jgi:flagellar assembly factor FliW
VADRDKENNYYRSGDPENAMFVVVNISADGEEISANMVAPVVIDTANKRGQQLVLLDSPFSLRHDLVVQEEERKEA